MHVCVTCVQVLQKQTNKKKQASDCPGAGVLCGSELWVTTLSSGRAGGPLGTGPSPPLPKIYFYLCVSVGVCMPTEAIRGHRSPGNGVTDSRKSPSIGAGTKLRSSGRVASNLNC